MSIFETLKYQADVCVVGGGLSGMCAAIAAARHGAKVVLMQDRPVLGGNASSEIRMWVCGAHGRDKAETGIIEELKLENLYRNPDMNYSVWDGILYEAVRFQEGITLLLNCSCLDAEMDGNVIRSVKGWQMTTQSYHEVRAEIFIDCSGDSVLAPLSGALYRHGREARNEFDEDIEPKTADRKTMGMSCMIQARQGTTPNSFIPPKWAYKITEEDLKFRKPDMSSPMENFWYLELGGESDTIRDAEEVRDELLKTAYGIWDYLKNDPAEKEKNLYWHLDWVGMLPGKRESRRYVGDYIMTQNDVRSEGRFDDIIAYGGWTMDDHDPAGFRSSGPPNIFHPAPSPYGIPYRCLYSKNIGNLMFAGRNISVTHAAMSSTRVMATCSLLGQAAGTAAALAVHEKETPRGVYERHIRALQEELEDDGCWLPFRKRRLPQLTKNAAFFLLRDGVKEAIEELEALTNGMERPEDEAYNGIRLKQGEAVLMEFGRPAAIESVRLVFDSDLNRETEPEAIVRLKRNMIHNRPLDWPEACVPKTLPKSFELSGITEDGQEVLLHREEDAHQRLYVFVAEGVDRGIVLRIPKCRGSFTGLFSIEAKEMTLTEDRGEKR